MQLTPITAIPTTTARWAAVGLAAATAIVLVLAAGAVGILATEGDPVDRVYLAVLAVLLVGATVARLRSRPMVKVLWATAATHAVVSVGAVLAGAHPGDVGSAVHVLVLNGGFVAGFAVAALLFRQAADGGRTG